jgi:hypothetical protein
VVEKALLDEEFDEAAVERLVKAFIDEGRAEKLI